MTPPQRTDGEAGTVAAGATVIALFGPTGVGKTEVALALAERLRADGEDPVAVSADALQVYAGLETLTGAATAAERARLEHRLIGFLPVEQTFSAGAFARRAHAEIDALLRAGRRPVVVGGTGLYLRAALAELDLRPPPDPAARERWNAELGQRGAQALHAQLAERDPEAAAAVAPTDAQRIVRTLELLDTGRRPPPAPGAPSRLWTDDTRHPTLLAGLTMDRDALYARIDARVEAMVQAGAAQEVRAAAGHASVTARKALGFEELLAGDVEAMKRNTRRYAKRQLTWMRKLLGALEVDLTAGDVEGAAERIRAALRGREARGEGAGSRGGGMIPAMRFEKWQALGNDYLIVERSELPFALTPERVQRLCHPHFGPGADGVLELSPPDDPGFVARLRILDPDGSEAELSGNGAREAILYLRRRGWTTRADEFAIQTKAGPIRPTIVGPTTCRVQMGRAALRSRDFPGGPEDGIGELRSTNARGASGTCRSATRSARCASRARTSWPAWTSASSGRRSSTPRASRTARTSRSGASSRPVRSGRGSSSAGWGRRCPPAPGHAARPSRTCSTAASRRSPCTWTAGSSRSSSGRSSTSCSPAGRCPCTAAS